MAIGEFGGDGIEQRGDLIFGNGHHARDDAADSLPVPGHERAQQNPRQIGFDDGRGALDIEWESWVGQLLATASGSLKLVSIF